MTNLAINNFPILVKFMIFPNCKIIGFRGTIGSYKCNANYPFLAKECFYRTGKVVKIILRPSGFSTSSFRLLEMHFQLFF